MLTGKAKTDYQRSYMQRYRAKNKDSALSSHKQGLENAPALAVVDEQQAVRPNVSVRPELLDPNCLVSASVRPEPHGCTGCGLLSYSARVGMSCPNGKVATSIQSVFEAEVNCNGDCKA